MYTIKLLLWVGIPSLLGLLMYKISKHDTALMNKEIERIEREQDSQEIK